MTCSADAITGAYPSPWLWRTENPSISIDAAIEAAREGDDRAFSHLIDQYRSSAERVAYQILRTEEGAADAVQEALIKAHRAMVRFQDGNFRSWFLRIVTNTCYDHLRRQKRRASVSLDEIHEQSGLDAIAAYEVTEEDPESIVMQNEGMRVLLEAIHQLPMWHRNVVMLVDVQGYDYGEAAEILHLPLGTVKSRLSRARAALRDQLVSAGVVTARPV